MQINNLCKYIKVKSGCCNPPKLCAPSQSELFLFLCTTNSCWWHSIHTITANIYICILRTDKTFVVKLSCLQSFCLCSFSHYFFNILWLVLHTDTLSYLIKLLIGSLIGHIQLFSKFPCDWSHRNPSFYWLKL